MNESWSDMGNRNVAPDPNRFAFGENWQSFLAQLDDSRIAEAEKSLRWLLGQNRCDGLRFLDIGSGSGLSSLAARRLGAKVYSFDYDQHSVECTKALRARYFPDDPKWTVEQGSILDSAYVSKLGQFDVVYSWGVLHHTGAMREAIQKAASLVMPGGLFVFALYRTTRLWRLWALEKRWYAKASPHAQRVARRMYVRLMRVAIRDLRRDFQGFVREYRNNRGMSFEHDVHDWLGGYPYETIRPAEVSEQMTQLGFELVRSKIMPYSTGFFGSGCDEYVYRAEQRLSP